MGTHECSILEVFFGDGGDSKKAFAYRLKQPCSFLDIILNDRNNCWDVITYNRFFYDEETEIEPNQDELLFR